MNDIRTICITSKSVVTVLISLQNTLVEHLSYDILVLDILLTLFSHFINLFSQLTDALFVLPIDLISQFLSVTSSCNISLRASSLRARLDQHVATTVANLHKNKMILKI